MLQRIQSVYLLLAGLVNLIALKSTVAVYISPDKIAGELNPFSFLFNNQKLLNSIGGGVLLIISALLAFFTIFQYTNRSKQSLLTILIMVLNGSAMLAYYFYHLSALKLMPVGTESHFPIGFIIPFTSIILSFMAYRGIKNDDALIKAADRIR
jgi:hypothetical protein